ncbi:C4-dicarboxylate TRAP transporter substrate-binding protein [Arthrobacter sulfonylureivorans]|uniref:C4-dicarboxylate TRAP transporter substrate-binding protein n=1 Tax=Arthrobacter sulfonylureivorans TaxID=2486855 RepID=A0ABY3WEV5_9MICC|nr:C4-dicarboxylate TRAP transporter substrate-binding protein [Arthrobacter sulfonylureivorans]UNK46921.1 C4-dicarboxylate TRAP transporter substrate-binding protein [Arthrobacter sulfonylureivorans]
MEPVTISFAEINTEQSNVGAATLAFAEEVEEKSNGKIKFDYYFSSSLMPGNEMLTGIGSGVAGAGQLITPYFPQELPVANALGSLASLVNDSIPFGVIQGAAATHEMYQSSDELQQELMSHNIKPLTGIFPYPQYDLLCTKPIDSLAAAQGARIRTPGELQSKEVQALGMVPVPMLAAEAYEALQRGVVDCSVLHPGGYIDTGLVDVANEYTPVTLSGYNGGVLAINLDIWNKLPLEAQQIVQDAAIKYWEQYNLGSIEQYARFAAEGPSEWGIKFNDSSELDAEIQDYQKEAIATLAAESDVIDQTFIDQYQSLLTKWEGITTELGLNGEARDASSVQEDWSAADDFDRAPVVDRLKTEAFDPYRAK